MVKKLKSKSVEIYVKGAPEVMTDICDKESRRFFSLPEAATELIACCQCQLTMKNC